MSFLDKLQLTSDREITARMNLINSEGDVVRDADGEPGWIEFWGPEAEATREAKRRVTVELFREQHNAQRKGKVKPLSEDEAERKLERLNAQIAESLADRVKDWRLVDRPGGQAVDEPCTRKSVLALFSDPKFEFLRDAASEFVLDTDNFFNASETNS